MAEMCGWEWMSHSTSVESAFEKLSGEIMWFQRAILSFRTCTHTRIHLTAAVLYGVTLERFTAVKYRGFQPDLSSWVWCESRKAINAVKGEAHWQVARGAKGEPCHTHFAFVISHASLLVSWTSPRFAVYWRRVRRDELFSEFLCCAAFIVWQQ